MVSTKILNCLVLFLSIALFLSSPLFPFVVQALSPPIKALVAPITKVTSTSLYTLSLKTNTNKNEQFLLDLSSSFLSSPCPCNPNHGNLVSTNLTVNATDGQKPTGEIIIKGFITACDIKMVAGLARSSLSLSSQIYSKLFLKKQFAICLPDSNYALGVILFGSEPFEIMPPTQFDVSTILSYTPFVKNPKTQSYLVTLNGIAINGLQIRSPFKHGTSVPLSTTKPYTLLRTDIYRPFIDAFNKATSEIPRLPLVTPFDICFNASSLGFSRHGYVVPQIDLLLEGNKNWTIFGINSVKQVGEETACLGFADGGPNMEYGIEIGGFQMENNFLLFDEGKSRLGFSSNLIFMRLTCGGFNFTTV